MRASSSSYSYLLIHIHVEIADQTYGEIWQCITVLGMHCCVSTSKYCCLPKTWLYWLSYQKGLYSGKSYFLSNWVSINLEYTSCKVLSDNEHCDAFLSISNKEENEHNSNPFIFMMMYLQTPWRWPSARSSTAQPDPQGQTALTLT